MNNPYIKSSILKFYFWFFSSFLIARILLPTLIKIQRFIGFRLSFSQFSEDLFFEKEVDKKGKYIEIGCNHPVLVSNSYKLYLRGWEGIVIDGDNNFKRYWTRARPRDRFLNALVSDKKEKISFFKHRATFVSSISEEHIKKFNKDEFKEEVHETVELKDIIQENDIEKFDILFIDIEGMDFKVISSLDLSVIRPTYICIEDHDFLYGKSEIEEYLTKSDYFNVARFGPSFIYKKL